MNFKIFSKYEAEMKWTTVDLKVPHIWISIRSPTDFAANIPANEYCLDILDIAFHDLTRPIYTTEYQSIRDCDADSIIDFVEQYKDMVDLIMCHCHAGLSRSPAVAMALSLWLNGDDKAVTNAHRYHTNSLVKTTLLRRLTDRNLL